MAINKVVNQPRKSHKALRRVLNYVLQKEKIQDGRAYINGPYPYTTITSKRVYKTWLSEKRLWGKDSGRMYEHNILSFHKDEKITPAQVLAIAIQFCERFFSQFQYLIAVHKDRDHLHAHIVTNSVSYVHGYKYHQKKDVLEAQKKYTNKLCFLRGFHVPEKGKHFDGTPRTYSEYTAWSKNKYRQMKKEPSNYIQKCENDILLIKDNCFDAEQFIDFMKELGWTTIWNTSKKKIVFEDMNGNKVSNHNLSQTFTGIDFSMDSLEFAFQKARKREKEKEIELNSFYHDVVDDVSHLERMPEQEPHTKKQPFALEQESEGIAPIEEEEEDIDLLDIDL